MLVAPSSEFPKALLAIPEAIRVLQQLSVLLQTGLGKGKQAVPPSRVWFTVKLCTVSVLWSLMAMLTDLYWTGYSGCEYESKQTELLAPKYAISNTVGGPMKVIRNTKKKHLWIYH